MVDIAEFYNVKVFKKVCEDFLMKVVLNLDNVFQMFELGYKYSLEYLKKSLLKYVSKNLLIFVKSEPFQNLSETMIYDFVELNQCTLRQEELFEMVYKWAEHQESSNESIKEKLRSLLPFFKFHLMQNDFLIDFVVKKSFLFSGDELSQILWDARYLITLEDENGKMMKGVLNCPDIETVYHNVRSGKRIPPFYSDNRTKILKLLQSMKPSEPSNLVIHPAVEWYLVCVDTEYFSITHRSLVELHSVNDYYLLAELTAEDGFQLKNSQIV